MMNNNPKPLTITSPDNPFAVLMYVSLILTGVVNILGDRMTPTVVSTIGVLGTILWALWLVVSGVITLWGVYSQTRAHSNYTMVRGMRVERAGTVGMFLGVLLYSASLIVEDRFTVFIPMLAVAALWRAIQITRQKRKAQRAFSDPTPTQILAVPEPHHDE